MKKILTRWMRGGVLACAIVISFAACSNSEFDGRTDTVYSLETPSVSAKAYPGVNVVSWKPVTGAKSYRLEIFEDGVKVGEISKPSNPIWHTAFLSNGVSDQFEEEERQVVGVGLRNGKKYTYYVEAVSSTNPGTAEREAYAKNSRGEASATAIVPPAGTSALLLPAFEGGYDGKEVNVENAEKKIKDDKFVVSSENISVSAEKSNIYINFPSKAYLSYGISLLGNDLPDEANVGGTWGKWLANSQSNNTNIAENIRVFNPGEYKVKISVKSLNNVYVKAEDKYYDRYNYDNYLESVVVSNETVTIESLNLSEQTGNVTAKYLADGKTAQVSFEPAKKDEVYVPASWYKVYRHVKGEYETTEVTTGIKETLSETSKKTYYVEDAIADNKQVYEYIVVVENDGKYGNSKTATLNIDTNLSVVEPTTDVTAEYLYNVNHFATGADNTVRISFEPAKKDGKPVPTSWYKVYRAEILKEEVKNANGNVTTPEEVSLVQIEVTSATNKILLDDKDPGTYVVYDKVADPAKAYKYTVVVENDGNFKVRTGTLGKATKPTFAINITGYSEIDSVYNDIEWTFSVGRTEFDVKDITVYLLMTSDKQETPKINEVIAKGERLSNFTKVRGSDYTYVVSKKSLSDGYAYIVVTATCDGYENAISNLYETEIAKPTN